MSVFTDPNFLRAFAAGVLACVACGVIGSYVVVKRLALISGGVSHASLGGVGIAAYFGLAPFPSAMIFALFSAVIIGAVSLRSRETEDTLIAALWALGMSIGVLGLQLAPDFTGDLEEYLFGNILLATNRDVLWTVLLNVAVVGAVVLFYKELLAISFDEEFAELRGVPVGAVYVLLLCLVAVTIVLMIKVVGVILLIALLTIPASMARWFTDRLAVMMGIAVGFGAVYVAVGMVAANAWDWPAGPTIVLFASVAYALGLGARRLRVRELA